MRANSMHFAAVLIVLSLLAGCVPLPPMQPTPTQPSPEARPLATQPPAAQAPPTEAAPTQAPPAQLPTTAPSATPSAAAPAAGLLGLVKAFEEAYNRHDVDATAGLFAADGCVSWGDRGRCGYWARQRLLYDAALNRELELSDCSVADGRVTCKGVQRDVCLEAGGLGETHYAPVVFIFEDGKILLVQAIETPEDAQRDLLFLYKLAGWAHRTRPAEWDKVERGDLLDNANNWAPFVDRTGAAMSALCQEYAAVAAAATPPAPTPLPRQVPPATGAPGSVLFIGDSFSWGLNNVFPKLAASGQPSVTVASKLDWYPSATLGVHYELGTALDDIRQGKWDVVVLEDDLQAGWPAREAEFYEYGRKFDEAIKQAGAATVFTMVQPYESGNEATTREIAAAYDKIGQELGDKVAPVGLAFRRALRERPDLVLYASDKEHPSPAGIYLEACVLYATITGRSPVGFTYRMQGEPSQDWRKSEAGKFTLARFLDMDVPGANWEIPDRDAADLQRIAWETVQEYQAQTPQPSSAPAPAAGRLALVKAFEEAYNRHDVDAAAGLFADDGCIDWGLQSACGYWSKQLLLYDAALNRELELSDCSVADGRVICKAVQRDVCLEAGGLGETHYAPVVFIFEDGKILLVQAVRTPEDAQRDLLFLYKLAGWAHRTRPAEWEKAGRGDLLDNRWYAPPFVDRTGAAMAALCQEYAAVAAAATTPSPTPAPRQIPPKTGAPGSVLFIGDNLSLALVGLFPKLAASGQPSVTVASQLDWYPSAALGAHYELGNALDDIRQGKWDVVVLEDDLQADWPARAAEFAEYGRRFDEAIKQAGAETVFTMVQPYESGNETTREETAAAYDKIGQDLGDKVAPVGLAFRRALRERPDLNLYAADGKQASWAGIYLEGCVLYATIFGRSPVGLTYRMQGEPTLDWQLSEAERYALAVLGFNVRGTNSELSEKDAADLQRIAWETVQDYQAQTPQPSNAPAPATAAVAEPDSWPTAGWKISTPEEQGMDSARLAAMFDAIDRQQLNLHSLLIIRNGYVVTEAYFAPYGPAIKHQLASVTKSVTGMLTGIAINQGRIESTGQPVLASFPNRTVANLDQNKRGLTLEHLLTMTGGLDCSDDAGTLDRMFRSPDWVQFTLDLPMAAAPGKKFSYCSPAVHLVSAILGQATGKSERELANETLFAPLGILPAGPDDWAADPQGISEGFAGLALTPRDMAKLGFLYLHGGLWNSQQVIPASWVAASLAPHVADESTGRDYGYLFWIYGDRGIYSALGLGGQDIHIIPAKNMVVVFTAAMDIPTHDEEVIKLLDEYIVPAAGGQPLPANPAAQAQLQARIARAAAPQALPPPLPALARSVSGKVYDMEPNPNGWNTISLAFQEGSPEAVATINGSVKVLIGLDNVYRTSDLGGGVSQATRGHWEGGDTFVIDANVIGNLLQWQSRMTFPDDQLLGDLREQVTGATNTIKGRAAP